MREQINFRGNTNRAFIRSIVRSTDVAFEDSTGPYSFAADSLMPADMNTENYICNTCHSFTNHHQRDGVAPGGQSHNDGLDCTVCHSHLGSFRDQLENSKPPAPHDVFTDCTVCHVSPDTFVPGAAIPNSACLGCHDPSAPDNIGGGSDIKVDTHFSTHYIDPDTGELMNLDCVECHNPMRTQINFRGNENRKFVRTVVRGNEVVFESQTGPYSFADDAGRPADMSVENYICNTCHTQTNHHRRDGSAPAQSHNDGTNCTVCHQHIEGFIPSIDDFPPPHNIFPCEVCHITPDTFVPNADIPKEVCLACHNGSVATKVDRHYSDQYIDPDTGELMDLDCVECHNPMFTQTNFRGNDNLKFIRTSIRGTEVVFEAYTGPYSFANDSGMPNDMNTENYICNTCHTQTNHHQNDGNAPVQSHNDGADCRACHTHPGGFTDQFSNTPVPVPHNVFDCTVCHVTPDTFVPNADIPKEACLACHDLSAPGRAGGGSDLKVDRHYSDRYTDPTTGQLMDLDCVECHNPMSVQTNFRGNDNLKFIRETIRGNEVVFEAKTGDYSFAATPSNVPDMEVENYICNTCHTQTNHHQNDGTAPGGQDHNNGVECTICHEHLEGFQPSGECIVCHSVSQGNRAAVVDQLENGNSHHIQGVELTNQHCYQCHWEANSDGSINETYHGGWANRGSEVNLVIYGSGVRPSSYNSGTAVEYMANGTRTERQELNQVCLGCHSAQNNSTQPFGDGNTPNEYAWDGMSIDQRYSQTGTTPWGKYSGSRFPVKNTQTKAYSAHGNAAANERGWDLNANWPDTSGSTNVVCFDCHNSHGSTVNGKTTSYSSEATNGAILKDTTAGKGGFDVTYKPEAGGSAADNNARNAGASLCFDCHMNANTNGTPWGYDETFGASQKILGYNDTEYFGPDSFAGKQLRFSYRQAIGPEGGHFGASMPLTTQVMGTINGLCTPCHDPHGVSPSLGSNQQYGVPLLKGTWITSPYKEDIPPLAINENRGATDRSGRDVAFRGASTPGYYIDQNTFANWDFNSTASVSQSDTQFAGLCMQCHTRSSLSPDTTSTWRSVDRIHNSVKGWDTDGNTKHRYTCSKCHTPHNAGLGRLVITNCLDSAHRGRIETGGRASEHSDSGRRGDGEGGFPAGGGGSGGRGGGGWGGGWGGGGGNNNFAYHFGTTSGGRTCHDNENNDSFPDNQLWNVVSPWGELGSGGSGGRVKAKNDLLLGRRRILSINNDFFRVTRYNPKGGVRMKKLTYVKPKVIGTASVHPC
jgi:hypothetical protein